MSTDQSASLDRFITVLNARLNTYPIGTRIGVTKIMTIVEEVRKEICTP